MSAFSHSPIQIQIKSLIAGEFDLSKLKNGSPLNGRSATIASSGVNRKKSDNTITISITSLNTNSVASNAYSALDSKDALKAGSKEKTKNNRTIRDANRKLSSRKRKVNLNTSIDCNTTAAIVYANSRRSVRCKNDEIFDYNVYSSSSTDEEENSCEDRCANSYPTVTMSTRITSRECDIEVRELRNQLISQKWLLSNLVKLTEHEVIDDCKKVKNELKRHVKHETNSSNFLETLLYDKESRITTKSLENSDVLRRGLCCFANNEKLCSKPSLPFTRHCRKHILYNEEQRLFERCTAKCPQTLNQCPNATFDIEREEPLCALHKKMLDEKLQSTDIADGQRATTDRAVECSLPIAQKGRKKPKPTTAAKTPRTTAKKKRRANSGGKLLNCSFDSSSTSFVSSHDSSEKSFASDSCDAGKVELSSVKFNLINTSSLSSKPNAYTSTSGIPSSLKSRSASDSGIYPSLPIIPMSSAAFTTSSVNALTERRNTSNRIDIPPSLDVGVPIAPGDEALVASLVADLPALGSAPEVADPGPGFDTDLIPDDAFNDLFMDNLKNGDIPSREEAEALEQALAAVSKDVHNLAVAAAVVSSGANPTNTFSDSFYSHPGNGQSHQFHSRPGATTPLNMTETDILGLASNILGSLTTEQQQQLNGLIDGALASGTLTSSPTLKSALASLTNDTLSPLAPSNSVTSGTQMQANSLYNTPSIARSVITAPASTTMHAITLPSPPPYAAQYNPPSAAVFTHELSQSQPSSQTSVGGLLLTTHDEYINQATFPSNTNLVNRKLTNVSLPSLLPMSSSQTSLPVLRTLAPTPVSLPVVKAGLESKMS